MAGTFIELGDALVLMGLENNSENRYSITRAIGSKVKYKGKLKMNVDWIRDEESIKINTDAIQSLRQIFMTKIVAESIKRMKEVKDGE